MALAVAADPTPVRIDADGVARVGDTRVRLASIVYRHHQGDSPVEIHESFPSVPLPDIYAAVAYYLRHQAEVDAYLAEQDRLAEQIREELEARPESRDLRERLRAHKEQSR